MSNVRAAARYASALLGVAEERRELETVGRDIETLESLVSRVPEFALFLRSPVISAERKKRALREVLEGRVGATAGAFVLLLAAKNRESLLPEILVQFRRLLDRKLGMLAVTARSAWELSADQRKALGDRIGAITGKTVRLAVEREPALIGGFTVQYEDTVWDASVRRQLELLRDRLAGA